MSELTGELILCDAATVSDGKVNVLGGWFDRLALHEQVSFAIAVRVRVHDPDDVEELTVSLRLDDVTDGGQPLEREPLVVVELTGGRLPEPENADEDESDGIGLLGVFNSVGAGPLRPDRRYVWSLIANDEAVASTALRTVSTVGGSASEPETPA